MVEEKQVKAYKFTVMGQYHTISGSKGKVAHFRDEVFILPEIVSYTVENQWERRKVDDHVIKRSVPKIETEHILRCYKHVIRRIYLPLRLAHKHEDFKVVRICSVTKREEIMSPAGKFRDLKKTAIQDMTEEELVQFCMFNDVNVSLDIYYDLSDRKMAVEQEWNAMQEKRRAEASTTLSKDDKLSAPSGISVTRVADDGVVEHHVSADNQGNIENEEDEVVLGTDIFS